jgi:hypothetical protein
MKKLIIALLVFFIGCAPWVRVGGPYKASSLNCSVELPDGWMRTNTSEHILVTRDGVLLQPSTIMTRTSRTLKKSLKASNSSKHPDPGSYGKFI